MNGLTAGAHLKRAYGFLQEVEKATENFKQSAIRYDDRMQVDQPFLSGILDARRGSKELRVKKNLLMNDLQLADREIDNAVRLDHTITVETEYGNFTPVALRALIPYFQGQLEMIWGHSANAKAFFNTAIQIHEHADPHYMLGLIFESEYRPNEARAHFERCLELDPTGDLSVSALREANAMKHYRKRFRGSWGALLLCFVFFFPAAFLYFIVKYK